MALEFEKYEITPIGKLSCRQNYPQELPRQGRLAKNQGVIVLNSESDLAKGCDQLEGFSHIWVVFLFHKNLSWKPSISPPRTMDGKPTPQVGVFASRSPYRPNPVGISLVELDKIEGHNIYIKNHDILNGTPIVDIKPYLDYADSVANSRQGWLEENPLIQYQLKDSELCLKQLQWLKNNCPLDFHGFISAQLSNDPLNFKKKRVEQIDSNKYVISFRTWRIYFSLESKNFVLIKCIASGYSSAELEDSSDKYHDKKIHRNYINHFNSKFSQI